jgi:hypothetical protein
MGFPSGASFAQIKAIGCHCLRQCENEGLVQPNDVGGRGPILDQNDDLLENSSEVFAWLAGHWLVAGVFFVARSNVLASTLAAHTARGSGTRNGVVTVICAKLAEPGNQLLDGRQTTCASLVRVSTCTYPIFRVQNVGKHFTTRRTNSCHSVLKVLANTGICLWSRNLFGCCPDLPLWRSIADVSSRF